MSATAWRRAVLAIVAVALVVRVAVVLATPHYAPVTDSADFDRHAVTLADHHRYPQTVLAPGGGATAFRPPVFPVFLGTVYTVAGTGWSQTRWRAGRLAEAALGAAAVLLLMLIAARLFDRRTALIAGGLAAGYPPLVLAGSSLLSESIYIPLLLGAVLAALVARDSAHRLRWGVLAGVLIGLAALTRSNGIVLALPVAALVMTWRGAIVVLAAAALTIVPWTVRNAAELHAFVPVSTQTGDALAGVYNDVSRHHPDYPTVWIPPERVPALRPVFADRTLGESAWSGRLRDAAVDYAKAHPAYIADVGWHNTLRLLNLPGPRLELRLAGLEAYPWWLVRLSVYGFWLLALVALVGAFTGAARRAPRALWAVPALIALSCVFVEGLTRYRVPADPFLLLLAALALSHRLLPSRR